MKISFHFKFIVAAIMLSQMAYTSEPTVEDLEPKKSAATAAPSDKVEEITQADPDVPVTQPIPCVNYYLVNPIKALGVGLFMGFGSPYAGIKELYYAASGAEPYEITKEDGTVVHGSNSLDFNGRCYHARQGAIYIVGAPLVGLAFFMLRLRSLNHPNESL